MKNQEIQNVVFTAIDIDSLIQKIAEKVLSIIKQETDDQNKSSKYQDLLNKPIKDCDLSIRAYNICWNADIKTLGELASYEKSDIRKLRNFGMKSEAELEKLLNKNHLFFGINLKK